MKLLHTSDWHLGHMLYNYDRTVEQQEMLKQIIEIVRDEQPDVFLLCGDVFHTAQPSSAVQTMFADALVAIHDAHPGISIIITAGNHDSGSRHEIFKTPWKALRVHTLGNIDKENPQEHIIEIPGKGYIIAVPYTHERNLPEGFFQDLLDLVSERNQQNLPVVMSAHTTISGCDFSGHDNSSEYVVGGIDSLDIKQLGEGYDYLALGHIHHAQFIHTGKHNVRYSGTPIAISFDEQYAHSVSMVEIDRHGDTPKLDTIEIENPHPLVTLPTEGSASWEDAKQLLSSFPSDNPAYIRLNVEIEDFLPHEANAEAADICKGKQCRFCHINAKRKTAQNTQTKTMTVEEFKSEEPMDIAKRFADDEGIIWNDEMTEMFSEAQRMVEEDMRNA